METKCAKEKKTQYFHVSMTTYTSDWGYDKMNKRHEALTFQDKNRYKSSQSYPVNEGIYKFISFMDVIFVCFVLNFVFFLVL